MWGERILFFQGEVDRRRCSLLCLPGPRRAIQDASLLKISHQAARPLDKLGPDSRDETPLPSVAPEHHHFVPRLPDRDAYQYGNVVRLRFAVQPQATFWHLQGEINNIGHQAITSSFAIFAQVQYCACRCQTIKRYDRQCKNIVLC